MGSNRRDARAASSTHFLNVDLDVTSRADLTPLVDCLEPKTVVMRSERLRGIYFASFELLSSRARTPDQTIAGLARLVEDLPVTGRRLWDRALARVFDIGIQAGSVWPAYKSKIEAGTLARVAGLRADVIVTVYPHDDEGMARTSPPRRARTARSTSA